MLLASAPAIVLYFALPIGLDRARLARRSSRAPRAGSTGRARSRPMTEELMSGTQWARAGTTLAVWMLLPLLDRALARHARRGVRRWRAAGRSG